MSSSSPELSERLVSLCERAGATLSSPSLLGGAWPELSAARVRELGELSAALQGARRPLTILMLGGTGVGKSTLLNALAGAELSSASSGRRAFTSSLHVYHHVNTSVAYLEGVSEPTFITHSAPQLLDKVIIDAPDIDSTEREHHELVWRALKYVDVILYVTTWQKYRNRVITQALSRYLGSHSVLCALNQADELSEEELEEVSADVRSSLEELGLKASVVLPISALSTRRAQRGEAVAPEELEGVATLSRLLREELTMSEVRSLSQLNATRRALRAVALLPQQMGWSEGFEGVVRGLSSAEQTLTQGLTSITQEGGRSLRALLREERAADAAALDALVKGPYGLYLTSQRWLKQHGYGGEGRSPSSESTGAARWLDVQLSSLSTLSVRCEASARKGGWSVALHTGEGEGGASPSADRAGLTEELTEELTARLRALDHGAPPARDALTLNAAPWLMVAVIGYWLLARVIEGPEPGLVSLIFGLVMVYGTCAAQERLLIALDQRMGSASADLSEVSAWLYHELTVYRRLKELERALHTSQDQLEELLAISQELATLHNQLNEAMRAPKGRRSPLLDALYRTAPVRPE